MDALFTSADSLLKPRMLLADDSRIVRAAIMKQVQGIFDFCEASDGEQAWEMLLQDASIRLVVTDLTMPKLDGYGLLARIRQAPSERLRTLPVVVVSGNDSQEERKKAKAAGATDLILKNVNTPLLLSRLGVLANIAATQGDYMQGLRDLMSVPEALRENEMPSTEYLFERAQDMLDYAIRFKLNVVMLSMCIGVRNIGQEQLPPPLAGVMKAIGGLLQASVRQSDVVTKVSAAEFAIASGSISLEAARRLAERLSGAIVGANILKDKGILFIASCGVMSLDECRAQYSYEQPSIELIWNLAHRRGRLGLRHGLSGVIGKEEEARLQ